MSARIRSIDAFEVTLPLPEPLQLGSMTIPNREYAIVRVMDEDGFVGTSYGLSRNAPISAVVLKTMAPSWQGAALEHHQRVYSRVVKSHVPLGTNGIFWRAISLLDCAIYDLLAQRTNQPLYKYLGGDSRVVPSVLVGGYPLATETSGSLAEQIQLMAARNPFGIKIGSSSDYSEDTLRLETCRQVMPDGPPLMIDLYWNATDAQELSEKAREWADFNMGWIEDPFPFDDFESVAHLSNVLSYPVAVGDEQTGLQQFEHLMDHGRIGIVRLDVTVCGGVTAFIRIAAAAATRNLTVSCHIFHHMHSHLAAAIPNVACIEYMLDDFNLDSIHLLWNSNLQWIDGGMAPTDSPGVGYQWNEDAIAYYRKASN